MTHDMFMTDDNIMIPLILSYPGCPVGLKIDNLCKWGTSTFKFQKRVLPSGKPKTISKKLNLPDPTWDLELKYFNYLKSKKLKNNLKKDLFIKKFLKKL